MLLFVTNANFTGSITLNIPRHKQVSGCQLPISEAGDIIFLRNVGSYRQVYYMAPKPRTTEEFSNIMR